MSARAAWRLDSLGFGSVCDYSAGKADWWASGLPIKGELADVPCVGSLMRRVVMTCRLDSSLSEVRRQMSATGEDVCVVVNDAGVILGRLDRAGWPVPEASTIEEAMRQGPSTYRPNVPLQEILSRMQEHDIANVLVTNPDGRLLGILTRQKAEEIASATNGHRALAGTAA